MSGYVDVRDIGQAVTLQEKKDDDDDDHDNDAIIMGFDVNSICKKDDYGWSNVEQFVQDEECP